MTDSIRDDEDILSRCTRMRRQGEQIAALELLQEALRRRQIAPEKLEAAGRFIRRGITSSASLAAQADVLLLGQCTTSWLAPSLTAVAWGHRVPVRVDDGGYDTILQDLDSLDRRPDVIVLLPWNQRLLADDPRSSAARVQDELEFLGQAWSAVQSRGSRLVQVGYDVMAPGPMGYHLGGRSGGELAVVRQVNEAVRGALPPGAYFVELEQVSAGAGRESFYDRRSYAWTKQPFSAAGLARLAEHLWAGIRAVTTGPKKVLVLDLDNTLWGGVVGEVGPQGIQVGESADGEAHRSLQRYVRGLRQRGIVLAVCSKNNPEDAREAFEKNADMPLRVSDFACFEASWDAKPVAFKRIASELQLGLDSMVFLDDNPAEREHIRQTLPEVAVVELPSDPADYLTALAEGLWFESAAITEADLQRSEQYEVEQLRRESSKSAASVEEYLASLGMTAKVRPIEEQDLQRVVQLLGKTNQFNLTTRRHTAEDVQRILGTPGSLGLALWLQDRFGDYGLISLVLAEPVPDAARATLRLDTWLMSCRAIGRTVEHYLLNRVAEHATGLGYSRLLGEYVRTPKNDLVSGMYERFGFSRLDPELGAPERFVLDLGLFEPLSTLVSPL